MKITKYPDNTSYVTLDTDRHLTRTFRINSYEDLWHLNQLVDAYSDLGVTPIIHIPNLIDAQADKRFHRGQSSGLILVLEFLRSMNAKFKIFHPHNPEVVEAVLRDKVEIIDNHALVKTVIENISRERLQEVATWSQEGRLILMSPDAGAFKPLMKVCDKIKWKGETYSASKSRKYENGQTSLSQIVDRQDFGGKDILIVDDLSVGGGTFKGLSKLLRERNVGKLYLCVSHMTVENLGKDPVTNYFDKVFTTNSKYDNYYVPNKEGNGGTQPNNLEIIKLF